MDALSEVLRSVRITSALFFKGEFSKPWRFTTSPARAVAELVAPGTDPIVLFHLVTMGQATVRVARQEDVVLEAGDMVLLPHGDAHEVSNGRTSRRYDSSKLVPTLRSGGLATEKWGGNGPLTKIICGYFGCERHAERLFLGGLPAVFKVSIRNDGAGSWIESAIVQSVSELEAGRAGRFALLSKLAEALFTDALCRYMDQLPPEQTGWLAGARDPVVGQALACIHRDPSRAWTLAELAKAIGASRTVLSQRFTSLLDESPLAYLARWRLQLAARLLETTDRKVIAIAMDSGYISEAAFNRAFKREFGLPPARYRRQFRAPPAVGAREAS
jgi:AraC-like DNA-binding protein